MVKQHDNRYNNGKPKIKKKIVYRCTKTYINQQKSLQTVTDQIYIEETKQKNNNMNYIRIGAFCVLFFLFKSIVSTADQSNSLSRKP